MTFRFGLAIFFLALAPATLFIPLLGWGEFCACVVLFWFLLEPTLQPPTMPWRRLEIELMLAETNYLVFDAGISAASELIEETIPWSAIRVVALSPAGVLFCNRKHQPVSWIPERALLVGGSRNDLEGLARKHRKKVVRLSGI